MAISGWGVFLLVLILAVLFASAGYIGWTHYQARRLGLPPPPLNPFSTKRQDNLTYTAPSPAPGGVRGWVVDKWHALRDQPTSGGAYASTGYGGSVRSGRARFGPLDPDEAWDARVDHEASGYYEVQELGLQDPAHGPYGGDGYGNLGVGGLEQGRGRSRSRQRELDERCDDETHANGSKFNPFGDGAEASNMSLRSISPRPAKTEASNPGGSRATETHKKQSVAGDLDQSPVERRSLFKEDV